MPLSARDLGWETMSQEQVVSVLIQLGLDEASVQKVKDGLMSVDDAVKKVEKGTGEAGGGITENVNQISKSFTGLLQTGRLMTSLGRAGTIFGRIFGDKDLQRMGEITRGMGLLVISAGRLKNVLGQLAGMGGAGSALLGAGAAIGGAALGVAYYDRVIGQLQPTYNYKTGAMEANSAANIFGQMASVFSYNVTKLTSGGEAANQAFLDTAKMYGIIADDAAIALEKMTAANSQYKYAVENIAGLTPQLTREGITDTSFEGLKAEEQRYKDLIAQMESGQLLEGPSMFLAKAQTRLKLIEQALGMVEKEMAGTPEVQAFNAYQDELAKAQAKYGDDQLKIQEETGKKITEVMARWTSAAAKAYEEFLKSNKDATVKLNRDIVQIRLTGAQNELRIEQDYYAKRAQQAENFGVEIARMEQDHAIAMQQGSQDHSITLRKLAEQLDAGAIEDENQKYRIEQGRKEQQYQLELSRKNEDYARQAGQDQQNFERERAQRDQQQQERIDQLRLTAAEEAASRKADWIAKTTERNDQYSKEITDLQQSGKDKLDQLGKEHQSEIDTIDANWTIRRRELGLWLEGERNQFNDYMKARQGDLQQWIDTHLSVPGSNNTAPSAQTNPYATHQWGGYQSDTGWAYLHGGEYVLSADTSRKMEQIVGGPLTQQNIRNMGPQIQIAQTFSGQESEPATYKRIMYEVIADVFTRARQQVGAA